LFIDETVRYEDVWHTSCVLRKTYASTIRIPCLLNFVSSSMSATRIFSISKGISNALDTRFDYQFEL